MLLYLQKSALIQRCSATSLKKSYVLIAARSCRIANSVPLFWQSRLGSASFSDTDARITIVNFMKRTEATNEDWNLVEVQFHLRPESWLDLKRTLLLAQRHDVLFPRTAVSGISGIAIITFGIVILGIDRSVGFVRSLSNNKRKASAVKDIQLITVATRSF